MELPYSIEELRAACHELIGVNGLPECYLRPIAFFGYGELGVSAVGNPVDVVIMSWPWGAYLGEDGMKNGITAKISSWERIGPNVIPHVAKATGVYLNSMLAVTEANRAGYDEAILLTGDGYIADGSGENVFIVKDGELYTPDLATSILPGITRDTVIQIAQDLGYQVHEKSLIRSDLYLADEAFMTGTAAEVTPLRSVDDVEIGVGPDHARDPGGLPGHRARPQRALGPVARVRHARAGRGLSTGTREIPLASPYLDEREEELVARGAALGAALARADDRPLRGADRRARRRALRRGGLERHRGPAPARAHRRARPGRRGDHLADLVRRPRRTASSSRGRRRSSPTSTRAR